MTKYVIRVVAYSDYRATRVCWVSSYDPEAYDGRGHVELTRDISQALTFRDKLAAFECWRQQSKRRPLRDDGKPNRPLTAWSVEIEPKKEGEPA